MKRGLEGAAYDVLKGMHRENRRIRGNPFCTAAFRE